MVSREGLAFQWKRVSGTLGTLLRNRMAAVGLILLFSFVFMALGAPLLSPYVPTEQVSGVLAQPEWVTNFPDGYYLSKNIVVVNDPQFNSPTNLCKRGGPKGQLKGQYADELHWHGPRTGQGKPDVPISIPWSAQRVHSVNRLPLLWGKHRSANSHQALYRRRAGTSVQPHKRERDS